MIASIFGLVAMTALMFGWRLLMAPPGGVRARVPRRGGVAVLRPPRGQNTMYAGLALAPTFIVLALLVKAEAFTDRDQLGLELALGLMALGFVVAASMLVAEFRQRLSVDPERLESVFILVPMSVKWSEVERIRWNPASRWFFLVAAGAWLWVPIDLDGIGDFAELALSALPPAVLGASPESRLELEELAAATSRAA